MISDGSEVAFVGPQTEGSAAPGDEGRVLVADDIAAHVSWRTGSLATQVSVVYVSDLSLREAAPARTAKSHVRESLDLPQDPEEALDDLADQGHMGRLSVLAEEASSWVEARVRGMDSINRHASLSGDQDGFVRAASRRVLREALEFLEGVDD